MPKVKYDGITFDSDLEIEYYKHLKEENLEFIYHPLVPIHINSKNTYTPDFIVMYDDRIEIVETKGYNQFSYMRDNMIHNAMLEKTEEQLIDYLVDNGFGRDVFEHQGIKPVYKKIKYLKAFGWVDWDFKNPNTLANKRKQKIEELEKELKELKQYKKDCERFFNYCWKMSLGGQKLTKQQLAWFNTFYCFNIATKDGKAKPIHLNLENIDKYMKENNHED